MLISEVILDLSQQRRLVKCSHSSKLSQLAEQPSQLHYMWHHVHKRGICWQERKPPSSQGVNEAVASGSSSHYTLKGIPPSGKLLHARNIWVPSLECSIANKWLLRRLDRLPTESNKEYHSLQTTSLCKKWLCKRGLCIFSKLTGLALGFASLHAPVSSAAECQVSHLSILFNNSPKLHLLDQ
jgi:hypothetical protein